MKPCILNYCRITDHTIYLNGEVLFRGAAEANTEAFLLEAYNHLALNYPKYYKMDAACKLAILASELVLRNRDVKTGFPGHEIGIFLSNSSSSLSSDTRYSKAAFQADGEFLRSPALFVYTLPNIMIGEIAIKHGITGENVFLVEERMNFAVLADYAEILYDENKINGCLLGWVETCDEKYTVLICYSEKKDIFAADDLFFLNEKNLVELYQKV